MSDNVSKPFVEYKKPGQYGTSLREPTAEELAASTLRRNMLNVLHERLKALKKEIKELEDGCPHTVSYDIAGFPYDVRMCHACNAGQGTV